MKILASSAILIALSIGLLAGYFYWGAQQHDQEGELREKAMVLENRLKEVMQRAELDKIKLRNALAELRALQDYKEKFSAAEYPYDSIEAKMASIKLRFNDLQREVADGKYPGLALTPAYQEMRKIFDHPDFDRLVRWDHTVNKR